MAPLRKFSAKLQRSAHRLLQLLFLVVLLGVSYRYLVLDANDPLKCKALLRDGYWLDPPSPSPDGPQPFRNWQPRGCMLHDYTSKEVSACLASRRLVFAGDSTVRQVFWATAKKLDGKGAESELATAEKHAHLRFERFGVELEFLWDPYLNSSRLAEVLERHRATQAAADGGEEKAETQRRLGAAVVLVGGGLWHARRLEAAPLDVFGRAVNQTIAFMRPNFIRKPAGGLLRSVDEASPRQDLLLLEPVESPLYEKLQPARAETITPDKIHALNAFLFRRQVSFDKHTTPEMLWSFSLMTLNQPAAFDESALHVVDNVAARRADILLNLRCNAVMAAKGKHPFDRTCCSSYSRPGWIQWSLILGGVMVLPGLASFTSTGAKRLEMLPSPKISRALLVLGFALAYCFFADRTQLFNKAQKQFSSTEFLYLCGGSFMLGLVLIRHSKAPSRGTPNGSIPPPADQPFLSRDQTDEWKGWMQFLVLVYHYVGASKVLWIYEIVRLLVAAYLFMTGYGHTLYFLHKRDYSLKRVAAVLVRLNLLSCILPYMMRTDYLFYYFAPLVSFWFCVVYLTMRIQQSWNESVRLLMLKIFVSAVLVALLVALPGVLESVFLVLQHTCRIQWNVKEWRFRATLDLFIVYVGMLVAILHTKIQQILKHSPSAESDQLSALIKANFFAVRLAMIFLSLIIPPAFWAFTRRSSDKYDYNWWHPCISPIPILSYVILRNSIQHFRNRYSVIFAWLGKCSLETFTLQFHIWLAGDTKGLLSTGLFVHSASRGRWEDFVILSALFLWVSWLVAEATATLTSWIVDPRQGRDELPADETSVELAADERVNGKREEGLERSRSPKDLEQGVDEPRGGMMQQLGAHVKENLGTRIGLMLAVMWVLNWTYV